MLNLIFKNQTAFTTFEMMFLIVYKYGIQRSFYVCTLRRMDLKVFKETLQNNQPPAGLNNLLTALWYDGKDDWHRAHEIAQDIETSAGSWVHAYLHRKEGDNANAMYWYRKAGKPMPQEGLREEWENIVAAFLALHH